MSDSSTWSRVRERLAADWTRPVRRDDDAVLEERARRLARPIVEPAREMREVLRARIGGALVLLPTETVRSVEPLPSWVRLPSTPPHLLGLARVGGALGPIFDVGPLLTGRMTELGAEARLVTVTGATPDLSLVVEAVLDSVVAPDKTGGAPEDAPPFITAIGPDGELSIAADALLADPRLSVDCSDAL